MRRYSDESVKNAESELDQVPVHGTQSACVAGLARATACVHPHAVAAALGLRTLPKHERAGAAAAGGGYKLDHGARPDTQRLLRSHSRRCCALFAGSLPRILALITQNTRACDWAYARAHTLRLVVVVVMIMIMIILIIMIMTMMSRADAVAAIERGG